MGMSMIRAVFEKNTEAFNRHDIEAFKANLADDVSTSAPGGVRLQGREQVGSFFEAWMDGFPDAHVELRNVHVTDDCVVEEGTFSGTHRGVLRTPTGDIPPTGRSVRARYVQVVQFRGERIASFDLTYDRLELLEQLGVATAPTSDEGAERQQRVESPYSGPLIG